MRKAIGGLAALLLLGACTHMVGAYRGPEPFGGHDYVVAPPPVRLDAPVRVVVLLLRDERPANEHELDFVRQANPMGDSLGQPREVRKEFDRAIKAGLKEHPRIVLVTAEQFAQTREAELVISGRIVRAEGEKKIGWSTSDFHARARIEILLRDGNGKALLPGPEVFSSEVVRHFTPAYVNTMPDEIAPGIAARGMEEAIRQVAEKFLASPALSGALKRSGAP